MEDAPPKTPGPHSTRTIFGVTAVQGLALNSCAVPQVLLDDVVPEIPCLDWGVHLYFPFHLCGVALNCWDNVLEICLDVAQPGLQVMEALHRPCFAPIFWFQAVT